MSNVLRSFRLNISIVLQSSKLRIQKTQGTEDKVYQIDTTRPVLPLSYQTAAHQWTLYSYFYSLSCSQQTQMAIGPVQLFMVYCYRFTFYCLLFTVTVKCLMVTDFFFPRFSQIFFLNYKTFLKKKKIEKKNVFFLDKSRNPSKIVSVLLSASVRTNNLNWTLFWGKFQHILIVFVSFLFIIITKTSLL